RDASADISAESDVTVGTKALPVEGNTRRIELCDQYPEATLQQVVSELSRYIGVAHCVHGDAEAGVVCAVTVEVGGVEEFGTSRVELAHIHIRVPPAQRIGRPGHIDIAFRVYFDVIGGVFVGRKRIPGTTEEAGIDDCRIDDQRSFWIVTAHLKDGLMAVFEQ